MLRKNDFLDVEIIDISSMGDGICRVDDFVIFVKGAITGDKVNIKIIKIKKSYAFGKLIEIIEPSKNRVKPVCPKIKCGGCDFQYLSYDEQLKHKKNIVEQTLKRVGGFENLEIQDVIKMDNPFAYRNKAQFPCAKTYEQNIVFGFYKKASHDIIAIDDCPIQHPRINKILNIVTKFLNEKKVSVYNENVKKGLVRHLVVKYGFSTNEIMVCLVINGKKFALASEFIQTLENIEGVKSILLNYNKDNTNVILGSKTSLLWGNDFITDFIGDVKFKISLQSFYQVNPVQTEKLYNIVLDNLSSDKDEKVIDAYCGIGTISLLMAKKVKEVIGIEVVEDAIKDAKENALLNNIGKTQFLCGEVENIISKVCNGSIDAIVVDPPRKGLDIKFINTIIEENIKKIIYVSCDVATLSRDLKIICENNYKIELIQPVDMFPHTHHVETVVMIKRAES